MRLWSGWLDWWRGTRFALGSPLGVAEAVSALDAAALATAATRAGRRDEEHLRRWIERRLRPNPQA